MLSFLTLLFPEVGLRMRSFPVALHRPWVRFDSAALVQWSSAIRQVLSGGGPTSGSSLSAARAVVSPVDWWSDLHMSVGLSSHPLSGFRVEPEPISISAASVKVVGVTRPVRTHTFSPLLALFFSFPRSQRS